MSKTIGLFVLENDEKINRAINGSMGAEGKLVGGIGEGASDEALIAKYDSLGGLITKDGLKVATGAFWDFEKKVARKEPLLAFEVSIEDEVVKVSEDEAKSLKVAKEKVGKVKKLKKAKK